MRGRYLFVVYLVHNSGKKSHMAAVLSEHAVQKGYRGRFSVGACNAHKLKAARRMSVVIIRHDAKCQVTVLYQYIGYTLVQRFGLSLAHHGHCTLAYCSLYIVMTVHTRTHLGHKATAFPCFARIKTDVAHLGIAIHRFQWNDSFYERFKFHGFNSNVITAPLLTAVRAFGIWLTTLPCPVKRTLNPMLCSNDIASRIVMPLQSGTTPLGNV